MNLEIFDYHKVQAISAKNSFLKIMIDRITTYKKAHRKWTYRLLGKYERVTTHFLNSTQLFEESLCIKMKLI